MAPFSWGAVEDLILRCRTQGLSAADRGRALEDLVAVTFSTIPGVDVGARNELSVFENEELDLGMTNLRERDGLPTVDTMFLVECKNWSKPVGSIEICWFATKLRRSGQTFGVLVSTEGITGDRARLTAARFEVATALSEGQQVVVLTLDELHWIRSGEQLARLLLDKQIQLIHQTRGSHSGETCAVSVAAWGAAERSDCPGVADTRGRHGSAADAADRTGDRAFLGAVGGLPGERAQRAVHRRRWR